MIAWLTKDAGRRALSRIFACLVVTRVAVWGVAHVAVSTGAPKLHAHALLDFGEPGALLTFLRWDVWWYVSVIEQGYWFDATQASNVAFLPGFPALIALLSPFFEKLVVAGLVGANASFVAAVVVLFGWVRDRAGVAAAERAVLGLLLYPMSFFFNTVYSEALFFLMCTLSLRDADRGRWVTAGIYAAIATLTRPMGILLVPAFAWALVVAWRRNALPQRALLALLLPVSTLGLYAAYLWIQFENPFVVLTAHGVGWGVAATWHPFRFPQRDRWYMELFDVFQLAMPFVLVALSTRAWRRLGPVSGIYAALSSAVAIVFGVGSVGRESLAVIPMFAALGLSSPGSWKQSGLYLLAFALLLVFTYGFAMGRFMG